MKPAKENPLAILRELRQVVMEAEDSASAQRRGTRVVDGLRSNQVKIRLAVNFRAPGGAAQAHRYLGEHPSGMANEEAQQLAIDPPARNDR